MTELQRALVIYKKSLYQIYLEEHDEKSFRNALRQKDPVALELERSHRVQKRSLEQVEAILAKEGIDAVCRWRGQVRSTEDFDLVIAVGGDGTVLDTAYKIVETPTPLLGINSDPNTSVGALCASTSAQFGETLSWIRSGRLKPKQLTRLRVSIDGEDAFGPCLNDLLFAHACPSEVSRFQYCVESLRTVSSKKTIAIKSSGMWIATATGSTAAIFSAGGKRMRPESQRIQFLVREPCLSVIEPPPKTALHGFLEPAQSLTLVNRMRRGMIWGDGPRRRISVSYGATITIDRHPCSLKLFLYDYRRKR